MVMVKQEAKDQAVIGKIFYGIDKHESDDVI